MEYVVLALLLAGSVLIALLPPWLNRLLRSDLSRAQDHMRVAGTRNPYISPRTNPDKFLLQLRVMAGVLALIFVGILVLLLSGHR